MCLVGLFKHLPELTSNESTQLATTTCNELPTNVKFYLLEISYQKRKEKEKEKNKHTHTKKKKEEEERI